MLILIITHVEGVVAHLTPFLRAMIFWWAINEKARVLNIHNAAKTVLLLYYLSIFKILDVYHWEFLQCLTVPYRGCHTRSSSS